MDGQQGDLKVSWKNSLQLRLSLLLSAAVLILAAAAGFYTFSATYRGVSLLQDNQLKQLAEIVTPYSRVLQENDDTAMNFDEDDTTLPPPRFVVQSIHSKYIGRMFENDAVQDYLAKMSDGFQDFELSGRRWRLYLHTYDKKHRIVAAERSAYREQIANDSAWNSVIPWILLIPVLWFLIATVLNRMFRHFRRAAYELDRRGDHDLQPLQAARLPSETYVFINAINRLLIRLGESFGAYRRFIGDAAHELRTPVTALSLQAARLNEVGIDEAERKLRIRILQKGVARMQGLLSDLLTLARIQNHHNDNTETSPVLSVLRQVIEDIMPAAQAQNIDLGMVCAEPCTLNLSEVDLRAVFKNLIENAVNYTPSGGQVDIAVWHETDCLRFCVSDNGPGVADLEKERIFEPFYRATDAESEGSGLGLAIVEGVCKQYGAHITLSDSPIPTGGDHHGLRACVVFPDTLCAHQSS